MFSVDYALRIYIDKLNNDEKIDLAYFKNNLKKNDYVEFEELVSIVILCKNEKIEKEFKEIFTKINRHKNALYSLSNASNFRSEKNSVNSDAQKKLDSIFEEVFEDE